jgi:hypothetical protein
MESEVKAGRIDNVHCRLSFSLFRHYFRDRAVIHFNIAHALLGACEKLTAIIDGSVVKFTDRLLPGVLRARQVDRDMSVRRWLHSFVAFKFRPNSSLQSEFISRPNDEVSVQGDNIERFYNSNFDRLNFIVQVSVARSINLELNSH